MYNYGIHKFPNFYVKVHTHNKKHSIPEQRHLYLLQTKISPGQAVAQQNTV